MNPLYPIEKKYFDSLGIQIKCESSDLTLLYECPICHDGKSRGKKHRCSWIHRNDSSFFNCFNCGYSSNFYNFVKEHGSEDLARKYWKEINSLDSEIALVSYEQKLLQTSRLKYLKFNSYIKPATHSKKIMNYLVNRKISDHKEMFFSSGNILCIPLYKGKNILGFFYKDVDSKQFWFDLPDENKEFRIWNWFKVNKNEQVYIFESVEDAISSGLKNIIAVFGTSLNYSKFRELKQPVLCFDNDEAGLRSSKKYLKTVHHLKILKYPKNFKYKDINDMKQDEFSYLEISKFIKDNIYTKEEYYLEDFLL